MLVSESLWGIGAALVLLLLSELRKQPSLRRAALTFGKSVIVVAILFNGYLIVSTARNEQTPFTYWRIASILTDPSLRERYISNTCSAAEAAQSEETSPAAKAMAVMFGQGLSTKYFQECLPANGVSLMLKSFGVFGVAALLAGLAMAFAGLANSGKFYVLAAVGFSMTSYPLLSYLVFWFWLPALVQLARRRITV
jgi:hypothetical protein